jgi:hypothetical protein
MLHIVQNRGKIQWCFTNIVIQTELSSFLTIYLMGVMWLFFFACICNSTQCDVRHNDDGICKITAPVFFVVVDDPASGNNILYI